ncbi:RrF2 family transcriptional regulator [Paenibacillus pini]|uniref:Rrf2 family transcriptional regulator n=1 Tax=Paenibacillus pini JCM 16418 TaxID=1236976 RepID=W7Z8D3_9BACL|nr:Rrf2 family transcriptional regulator [Paenibacillus pini]GAF10669.1 Rrf2 family transcriptional regulator [Paenibacillus pini JCM 16418]
MHMKTGVEQSVYAIFLLNLLPDKAVLPGEAISQQLGTSATYFQKLLRKLVSADLITSVPGVKGGFKLKKKPNEIRIYDIYIAIEGQQTLYSSSGILNDMLELKETDQCCLLTELMEEAESSWKSVLKRETVASIYDDIHKERFKTKMESLQIWIKEKMVV